MKRNVKYALMQYVPSFERDERINVAVILHSTSDKYLSIKLIENWKRLKEFDDEIDIDFMKNYLKTFKEQFSYNPLNVNEIDIDDEMLVEKMTQYYINQFVFKISEIPIESTCEQFLEKLKNNYLYFDIDKKNGKHIIQSYDKELLDKKGIGNTCVGLTYYETKLIMKKMRKKKWN